MNTSLFSLMLTYTGALVFWFFKGMKSPLRLETSGRLDRDFKYFRNFVLAKFALSGAVNYPRNHKKSKESQFGQLTRKASISKDSPTRNTSLHHPRNHKKSQES